MKKGFTKTANGVTNPETDKNIIINMQVDMFAETKTYC